MTSQTPPPWTDPRALREIEHNRAEYAAEHIDIDEFEARVWTSLNLPRQPLKEHPLTQAETNYLNACAEAQRQIRNVERHLNQTMLWAVGVVLSILVSLYLALLTLTLA